MTHAVNLLKLFYFVVLNSEVEKMLSQSLARVLFPIVIDNDDKIMIIDDE